VVGPALNFIRRSGARRRWPCVALTGVLLLLGTVSSEAQQVTRQVLLLQSLDRGNLPVDQFTGNFRVELDQRADSPVNVIQIMVGPIGFVAASEQAVVDYIRSVFIGNRDPDLIVSIGGPAAVFARKHRQHLFPHAPLLLASVDQRWLANARPEESETAVAIAADYPDVIDAILRLLPQTRQVVMVIGSGQIGQFWHRELEGPLRRFGDRVRFVWLDDLSLAETLARCASLPANSAIFYLTFGTDATGAAYADDRVFADLHARANAPLFAALSPYFGAGIVGGSLISMDELARTSADTAIRLLNGAAPASVKVPPQRRGQPVFDWRELERWGIPETSLPSGSIVRYRAPSLWSAYRSTVLGAICVLAIQSLLIVGLLYQRRARQRAEIESRNNLALAADASRRLMMSALTSSIAHELGQPLSSMIHNAQAGRMMITADRSTPDAMGEILSDIETEGVQATQIIDRHRSMLRGHQLDTKPIDLHGVIDETLALVAHDMKAREIEARVRLSPGRCVVDGDQVLLQQVLVNLVMNAMDAMTETPPARRRLTISTAVRGAEVDVAVRDAGTGLPAPTDGALFTPFVTTKAHGLGIGLTITQTIVDAHRGTIDARNNPEGGATFTVTLRRTGTPELQSRRPSVA
jgi:signal transduction histidine kinase